MLQGSQVSDFKITAEIGLQSARDRYSTKVQEEVLEEDEGVRGRQDAGAEPQEASAELLIRRAVMAQATVLCHKKCQSRGDNTHTCVESVRESWQLRRPRSTNPAKPATMPRVICTAAPSVHRDTVKAVKRCDNTEHSSLWHGRHPKTGSEAGSEAPRASNSEGLGWFAGSERGTPPRSPFSLLAQQLKSATQEDLEERLSTYKTLQRFLLQRASEEDVGDAGTLELKISTNAFLLSIFFWDGALGAAAGSGDV